MYNLLIADDDEITREGIRKYLLGKFTEIETIWTAKNGAEAFSLFEEHKPDIVITDITMPVSDGLELVEKLHQNGYKPKVVIISAHENFSYAQNAVRLGVEDYLIKPILPTQIFNVVSGLLQQLNRHNAFLSDMNEIMNSYKESLPIMRQRFFTTVMQGRESAKTLLAKAGRININLSGKLYMVAAMRVASVLGGQRESFVTADGFSDFLTTSGPEIFSDDIRVYGFVDNGSNVVLIAVSEKDDPAAFFRAMNRSMDKLINSVKKSTGLVIEKVALGRQCGSLEEIRRSYQEALEVLISIENQSAGTVCNYEDISPSREIELTIDAELEKNLLHYVKYQSFEQCLKLINQLEIQLSNYRFSRFEQIKSYFLQMTVLMWREYQAINDKTADFQADFVGLLGTVKFEDSLAWFKAFVQSLVANYQRKNEEKGHWLVNRAKCIINDNISNGDFSIDDAAVALYVSSNYLRRLFREQTGESFVEYLTRIRMKKSIELLKETNLKIQEIAEATGYSNQRYFAVCFKKHFSKTPTEIREKAI